MPAAKVSSVEFEQQFRGGIRADQVKCKLPVIEELRILQVKNGYAAPADAERVEKWKSAVSQEELNGVGRARCRRNGPIQGTIDQKRLKITRMRWDALNLALDRGEADDVPAGGVSRFKPAIGDEVCSNEIGKRKRRSCAEHQRAANGCEDKFFHSNLQVLEPIREISAGPGSPLAKPSSPHTSRSDGS